MTERVLIPLPDGRWLALSEKSFRDGVRDGANTVLGGNPGGDTDTGETWLTPQEMAERTRTTTSFWMDAHRAGSVSSRKFGKSVRFPASSLAATESESVANPPTAQVADISGRRNGRKT